MKIIPPITITDALLISSNITENDYAAYNAATTYALGDRCILASTHKIYESAQAGNTAHNPPDNLTGATPWWLDAGPTNRWAMLDGASVTQATNATSIVVALDSSNQSAAVLLEMDAVTLRVVTVDDDTSTTVLDETIALVSTSNVIDAWTYFFSPFFFTRNILVNLPLFPDSTTTATLTYTGGTAKCGDLFLGNVINLGKTKYGMGIGINSYSANSIDDFGNYTILRRPAAKKGNFDLTIRNSELEYILSMLFDYESVPVVWIATETEGVSSPTMIYGKYRDFSIVIPYLERSLCSIEIDGILSQRT